MSYYPTLAEDLARAKAILAEGRHAIDLPIELEIGGTIYGKDIYAAYKLLESFVAVIEAVGPRVCELALRAQAHERAARQGDRG